MILGIIGGGMMGEAILAGIIEGNFLKKDEIIVSEKIKKRKDYLREKYNVEVTTDNKSLAQKVKYILIAVKPQNIKEVLKEISPYVDESKTIISIAAGVKISLIKKYLNNSRCVIRVMPNLSCTIKKGVIALTFDKYEKEDVEFVKNLFSTIGDVWIIEEKYFDTITALTGSGPAFVSTILQGFTLAGVKGGIPYDTSKEMVLKLFEGVIEYIKEKNLSFEDVIKMTSSPAGTTIMGLEVLYKEGVTGIIMEAITSAKLRSEEISKNLEEGEL